MIVWFSICNKKALSLWVGTAAMLAASALAGYCLLDDASKQTLAKIRCFAAGAVLALLATEVFPKAFNKDHRLSGIAVAIGVIVAFVLHSLGSGMSQ